MAIYSTKLNRRRLLELGAGAAVAAAFGDQMVSANWASAMPASLQLNDVPREKTLIVTGSGGEAMNQFTDIDMVNPYLTGVSRSGYQLSFEPLAYYNMVGGDETLWLAKSYEYNDDFTELNIEMRDDGFWSDGTPITAADLAFTLTMLRDDDGTLLWSIQIKQWVKEANAVDDTHLQILLNEPNPRFFFDFLTHHADIGILMLPKHIWENEDPHEFKNFDLEKGWPVVTGPYKLVQSNGEQKMWDRRDDWWAAKAGFKELPAPERLIFLPAFDESKMGQLIINNDVDTTLTLSVTTITSLFAQNPKITTFSGHDVPYGNIDWWVSCLGFNCEAEPWNDPDIRWAMSYALDREKIVEFGFRGAGESTVLPYPYYPPLMKYVEEAQKQLLPKYPTNEQNLDKMAELLQNKGYAKGSDGIWAKDGKKLSMIITTYTVFADTAPFVTEQLKAAGIDASFQMPTTASTEMQTGEATAFITGHTGSVRDPFATMELYHSKFYKPTGEPTVQFFRWRNAEYDAIVDQMGVTAPDDPKIMDLFLQGTEIWLRELPAPPLLQFYHRVPMNETYWVNWPNEENPYINPGFMHRTVLLMILGIKPATS